MQEVLDRHYKRLADDYDQFLYYSPEFVRALTSKMLEKLELQKDDVFVDLGCGTAMYSIDIQKQLPLNKPVLGVDPYEEMLAQIPPDSNVTPVAEDALDWSAKPATYNKILIKEAVHHIAERAELFKNLYERLAPGGILLLVHVPPDVKYPLFDKALERCKNWHANPDELVQLLKQAGFQVERDSLDYEHTLPKEHYFNMVRNCYMSALTSLEPDVLEAGLKEMAEKYADQDTLRFTDHFDYLTAKKV